jgi:hypothetical protein
MVIKVGETQKGKRLKNSELFPSDLGGLAFKIA